MTLKVAILGLGKFGSSVGLALQKYMSEGGKHDFDIVGYDSRDSFEKTARTLKVMPRFENHVHKAVQGADIVVMALSYDEVQDTYKYISNDLRDGVVILDMSPLKQPSIEWSRLLTDEHHVIGMTPIINAEHLYNVVDDPKYASADLFRSGAMLIAPSASAIKEAVDLAFSFSSILGALPQFVDPVEHDILKSNTDELASVLGVALFYHLARGKGWDDIQRFTNSSFGALTHQLYDTHPDALRDEWMANRDNLARNLSELIETLREFQSVIEDGDRDAIEAVLVGTSEEYEKWYNRRVKLEWSQLPTQDVNSPGIMTSLFGSAIANRIQGKDDDLR